MSETPFVEPARFALFLFHVDNGRETHRERYGNYHTLAEAREAAAKCVRQSKEPPPTFGGLLYWSKPPKGRRTTYRIFEATGWREHPATAPAKRRA